jgi:hypothetical protein
MVEILAVMITIYADQVSWLSYLLATLGGGLVGAVVFLGIGRIVGWIVGVVKGCVRFGP